MFVPLETLSEGEEVYSLSMRYMYTTDEQLSKNVFNSFKLCSDNILKYSKESDRLFLDFSMASKYYYIIEINSVKSIHIVKTGIDTVDIFFDLKYPPTRFLEESYVTSLGSRNPYLKKNNKKIVSRIFTKDYILSSCFTRPVIKLSGVKTYDLSAKMIYEIQKKNKISYMWPYIDLGTLYESRLTQNMFVQIDEINALIKDLAFPLQYAFLSMFSSNRLSLFGYNGLDPFQIKEAIRYLISVTKNYLTQTDFKLIRAIEF